MHLCIIFCRSKIKVSVINSLLNKFKKFVFTDQRFVADFFGIYFRESRLFYDFSEYIFADERICFVFFETYFCEKGQKSQK